MDAALLHLADETIRAEFPKMYSFLVAKDGKLVFERYYGGADAHTPMDLRSATKSVTAAVVGAVAGANAATGFGALLAEPEANETGPAPAPPIEHAAGGRRAAEARAAQVREGRRPDALGRDQDAPDGRPPGAARARRIAATAREADPERDAAPRDEDARAERRVAVVRQAEAEREARTLSAPTAIAENAGPTLGDLFPALLPRTASEALRRTTLRQLLGMTSGLHWITGKRLGEKLIPRLHRSAHWVRFALRLPVNPDTRDAFQYRSVDSHLLSAAVTAAAGRSAAALAQEALFAPLGIAAPSWEADPQGITAGHIGLALTGRDLAKLGWLHAAGGVWEGRRLLPEAFVRQALTPHTEGLPAFGRYGWQWWIARTASGEPARCMLGHGGQAVFVLPERRLVAVFTANPRVSRWKHPLRLLERFVLPADPRGSGR